MSKLLKKIVNGEFINVMYNGDIYLLVDEFVCDKKRIIYFNSLNNELFCYKKGNEFEIIDEEKIIEKVKDENGLYKDEYLYHEKFSNMNFPLTSEEITGGERRLIIEKALDNIKKIKSNEVSIGLKKVTFKFGLVELNELVEELETALTCFNWKRLFYI